MRTAGGLFGDADATVRSGDSDPQRARTAIRGGAQVTGFEGVDVRALIRGLGPSTRATSTATSSASATTTTARDRDLQRDHRRRRRRARHGGSAPLPGARRPGDRRDAARAAGGLRPARAVRGDRRARRTSRQIDWDSDVLLLRRPEPDARRRPGRAHREGDQRQRDRRGQRDRRRRRSGQRRHVRRRRHHQRQRSRPGAVPLEQQRQLRHPDRAAERPGVHLPRDLSRRSTSSTSR